MKGNVDKISKILFELPILTLSIIGIVLVIIVGVVKNKDTNKTLEDTDISYYMGDSVSLKVRILPNYIVKSTHITSDVECLGLLLDGGERPCTGKLRVTFKKYLDLDIGEIVVIKGKLIRPENFSEEFSYVDYLADLGISSVMYYPDVVKTGKYQINPFVKALYSVRDRVIKKMNMYFPEPHASLLSGILLGVKNAMPEGLSEDLQRTGTTHIIAASGYNVTVISSFLISSLKFISRRLRVIVGIVFVWGFVIISGGSIPVVRAAMMVSMSLLALFCGRYSNVTQSLFFSAAVMFLMDNNVYEDISFQLSFMSTVGLIYIVPVMKRWLSFVPSGLEESITVTLSAILSTFPITAVNFHSFSLISLVANLFLLPTIETIMLLGTIFVVVPKFLSPLLTIISTILWVPLDYFISITTFLSSLPFASVDIPKFSLISMIVCYVVLGLVILKFSRKESYEVL